MARSPRNETADARFDTDRPRVRLTGRWTVDHLPAAAPGIAPPQEWFTGREVVVDASALGALDTAGCWQLGKLVDALEQRNDRVLWEGLEGSRRDLYELVRSRQAQVRPAPPPPEPGGLEAVGRTTRAHVGVAADLLAFIGETATAILANLARPGRIRFRAMVAEVAQAGVDAIPIVALLSFLLGVTLAYQASIQLRTYGANIYIVDLTALTIFRELASLMTAVIVAGRTGSAHTAEIGTMKMTEELDALRTIGIAPFDLLVVPRILGLAIALPLLTLLADLTGIFGAMLTARTLLDISFSEFLDRLPEAISVASFVLGIIKAPVFAAIIATVGCFQGFRASGTADSVGRHTTISVVQSIFLVIVADAAFSVIFSWLEL